MNQRSERSHHRPGGTAGGRGVEIGEAHPLLGELIEVRRSDLAPKASHIAEAQIVRHNHQEIGTARRGSHISVNLASLPACWAPRAALTWEDCSL